jgi:hypothetical protein
MNSCSSRRKSLADAGVLSAAGIISSSFRLPLGEVLRFEDQTEVT